ncbi:hypothetical protein HZD82_25220, partial [Pantoea agglomerans]|nr:hypothetical protein [Pantoea agglomerans]
TRASNMYFSQFLLGFSSAFFMAPAMLMGIGSVVTQPKNLVMRWQSTPQLPARS